MSRRQGGYWLGILAVLVATGVLAVALHGRMRRQTASSLAPLGAAPGEDGRASAVGGPAGDQLRRQLWRKAQVHLDWADRRSLAGVDESLGGLDAFFTASLEGVGPFAEAALGLEGKIQYLRGAVSGPSRHEAYLQQQFERHIFSGDQLRQAVQTCVADYAASLERVDNQLLVLLRADVAGMPAPRGAAPMAPARLEREYRAMLSGPAQAVSRDVQVVAAREAGLVVAGELASAVAVRVVSAAAARLGVSSGLLAVGAGTSWASFGLGLAAAMLADRGVDWAMQRGGYNPRGRLAAVVAGNLLELKALLIEGDADVRASRRRLERMAREDPDAAVRSAAQAALERIEARGYARGLRYELEQMAGRRDQARRALLGELILLSDGGAE